MLCMAGWLRRGCSTSEVKRSSSSKQSIGLTDGCRRHGERQEKMVNEGIPVRAKRQVDLIAFSVFIIFLPDHIINIVVLL